MNTVETAETGHDALERMKCGEFNVYLIDIVLPDMNGTELLRQSTNNRDVVKIIMTGFSTGEVGKTADLGADDYLVKPLKAEELIAVIQERLVTKQT
jgi:DNA-binding response OmpR family regulator